MFLNQYAESKQCPEWDMGTLLPVRPHTDRYCVQNTGVKQPSQNKLNEEIKCADPVSRAEQAS